MKETISAYSDDHRLHKGDATSVTFTHVIFDLASLRFKLHAGSVTATTSTGEQLGVARIDALGDKEACLSALDDAAARARIWRFGTLVQVAFYNPYTAEVSLGPSYSATNFRFNTPVGIEPSGTLATLRSPELVTINRDVAVLQDQPSVREILRRLSSVRTAP